jgi:hypothetical protein
MAFAQNGSPDSTRGGFRLQPLPVIGSAPETGLQYGATLFAVRERPAAASTRPASVTAYAVRTAKQQTRVGIEGETWTRGNAVRLAGSLQWQRYPLPFYGIGDDTPERAKEIFTPRGVEAQGTLQVRVRGPRYALAAVRVADMTITPDSTGQLRHDALVGTRGGRTTELTGGLLDDSRDNIFAPASGRFVTLSYTRAVNAFGADFRYGRIRLDARGYHPVGGGVLAMQLVGVGVTGDVPFDALALAGGGDILRGYPRGRYRDRVLGAAQLEYRSPAWHRLGAALFAGAGTVSGNPRDLFSSRLLPTYGAGLRLQLDPVQRTAIRVDYGRGTGNSGLYVGLNQAF